MIEKIKNYIQKILKSSWRQIKVFKDPRALGLLAFGAIVLLITWSGIRVAQDNYELAKKISVEKQRNDISQLENDNLRLKNQYYETDQFLELAARRQFGKAKPDEKLYIVTDEVALKYTKDRPKPENNETLIEKQKTKFFQNIDAWIDFLSK